MMMTKAPSHPRKGTKARRSAHAWFAASRRLSASSLRRAFSLIEVLLAIFILGIGVISIAALFPAGIAQQRLSVDDMMGKVVADSAIELIRSKVQREDFGTFEEFDPDLNSPPEVRAPRPTVLGDWTWLRPGFLFGDDPATTTSPPPPTASGQFREEGSIDIFSWYRAVGTGQIPANLQAWEFSPPEYTTGYPSTDPVLWGIPYNKIKYGTEPPRIIITQRERYYPMAPHAYASSIETARPEYVWDCMFRRFQGKVYVAIFVYRVTSPGGGTAINYRVPQNPNPSNDNLPPVPVWVNLVTAPSSSAGGAWDTGLGTQVPAAVDNRAIVLGNANGNAYNPDDAAQSWQQPRQWIIDQNNNIHRTIGNFISSDNGTLHVELSRPLVPVMGRLNPANQPLQADAANPTWTHFYYHQPNTVADAVWRYDWVNDDIVTDIWYLPLSLQRDDVEADWILTPIYVAVKEL